MTRVKWIVALALALAAGGGNLLYLRQAHREATGGEPVAVLVAARELAEGTILEEDRLALRAIPAAFVDRRAVTAERLDEVLELPLRRPLEAGQALLWQDVIGDGDPPPAEIQQRIPSGERAIAIPVDAALSLGGLLRPGHRVDILGTFSAGGRGGRQATITLLQNVTVLACGDDLLGREGGRYRTATLSVALEEAQLLAYAAREGELSLVLRGEQDLEVVRGVPPKGPEDVWEEGRREALQERARRSVSSGPIERLSAR